MANQLNELVQRLTATQPVECSRPNKTVKSLKECIDRDYVHIMFKNTGTELGVQLNKEECSLSEADFEQGSGSVKLVGYLTLNYDKVKCIATIDLTTCEGEGNLEAVTKEQYDQVMASVIG